MTSESSRPNFGRMVLTGVLVTVLILAGKLVFEHTDLYRGLQSASYSWLQSKLRPPRSRTELPVVIVDIASLQREEFQVEGKKYYRTPRKELQALVEAVVKQQPQAVGIDIDFSPDEIGYRDPGYDPIFFRKLLELSNQVRIFVGIRRTQNRPPSNWLTAPEFESLAASIWGPPDQRKMLKWLERSDNPGVRGPGMSLALAQLVSDSQIEPQTRFQWALTPNSEEEIEPGLKAGEFLVDYSALQALQDTRITTKNPTVVEDMGWTLKGKVVLIGNTAAVGDIHPVPVLNQPDGVPGIYKHASGVYTLIKAPLFELTGSGRVALDVILSCLVFLPVLGLSVVISRQTGSRLAERTAFALSTTIVTILALAIGVVFVSYVRTMWDDFPFVIVALWLHRPLDNFLHWFGPFVKKLPGMIIGGLTEPNAKESVPQATPGPVEGKTEP